MPEGLVIFALPKGQVREALLRFFDCLAQLAFINQIRQARTHTNGIVHPQSKSAHQVQDVSRRNRNNPSFLGFRNFLSEFTSYMAYRLEVPINQQYPAFVNHRDVVSELDTPADGH